MNKNKYWGNAYRNNLEVGSLTNESDGQPSMDPGSAPGPEVIEVVENKIYFYADIDREKVLRLNKTIDTLNNDLLYKSIITNHTPPQIYLHINSLGGHIFDAFSVVDTIKNSRIPISTVIDGCAASAATLISVVGHKRYIKKHSYFLIHQISSAMWGKYEEFKDEMENLDKFMNMIKNIYKDNTKLPMKTLNEILKHDLWFDANDAVKYGLVDSILENTNGEKN